MACAPACGARAPEPAWPRRRPGGTHLGRDLVFGGRGFDVFQLQFHLIEELTAGLGTAAIELPPHLLYGKLEMGDQRASALETLAAARAAAAAALVAFASASMRAARSAARSRLRLSKSSGRLSIGGVTVVSGAQIA
jgi:alkylation response protein AidB-like acyl-CoA dehydrogenase